MKRSSVLLPFLLTLFTPTFMVSQLGPGGTTIQIPQKDQDLPVLNLDQQQMDTAVSKRDRSQKPDDGLSNTPSDTTNSSLTFVDRVDGTPALPTNGTLIISGTVLSRSAELTGSGPETSLSVRVDRVIQQPAYLTYKPGSTVLLTRYGANVVLPSGKLQTYRVNGERMPQVNGNYLFFVALERPRILTIRTAYALNAGVVKPLDDADVYAKFNGVSEHQLLAAIESKRTQK